MPWRRDRLPTTVFLPRESPWTEEPERLQSMGSQRVRQDQVTFILFIFLLFVQGRGNLLIVKLLSRVRLFATPWTGAYQALPSMGFSGQEYWSGLPFPSPEDLPDPAIEPGSPTL